MYLSRAKQENGAYPQLQSEFRTGLLFFPDEFLPVFFSDGKRAAGFVDIEHNGTTVTSCTWNEAAYQAWCEANPETDYLAESKASRIAKSKTDLASYLESHPLLWTDGKYYSITSEKQQWLTSKLFSASAAKASGEEYYLTWNDTAEICTEWSYENLWALARAIDVRVTTLVTYQQTQEVAMRNAATLEKLDAIVVDYDSVLLPGGVK